MSDKQTEDVLRGRIAELELQVNGLEKDLIHDSLTELKTRSFFEEESKIYLEMIKNISADKRKKWFGFKNISFLFLDIDYFKKVNDTYGHDIGDVVLKKVARVMQRSLRAGDTVARWGGEEIVASLLGADLNDAKAKAEDIRENIEKLTFKETPNLKVTVSIGVVSSEMSLDFEDLIKKADLALYKSKHSGRNRITIHSDI